MKLPNWFNTRDVDEFAHGLVEDLLKRYPPEGKDFDARKSAERLRKTHDVVFSRAQQFAGSKALNSYKVAHLGTQVKWGLKEAGYPMEFVNTFTLELLSVVTIASRKRKKGS